MNLIKRGVTVQPLMQIVQHQNILSIKKMNQHPPHYLGILAD